MEADLSLGKTSEITKEMHGKVRYLSINICMCVNHVPL